MPVNTDPRVGGRLAHSPRDAAWFTGNAGTVKAAGDTAPMAGLGFVPDISSISKNEEGSAFFGTKGVPRRRDGSCILATACELAAG